MYCCVVLDAWSRRVVGWAIDSRQRADLATNALGMAIDSRAPAAGGIIHGDHGTQFTSWTFTERAREAGLLPSLGTVGDPTTTPSPNRSGPACRPSCSTGSAGTPASSRFRYADGFFHRDQKLVGALRGCVHLQRQNA